MKRNHVIWLEEGNESRNEKSNPDRTVGQNKEGRVYPQGDDLVLAEYGIYLLFVHTIPTFAVSKHRCGTSVCVLDLSVSSEMQLKISCW